jgi:hypothetical protein
MRMLRAQLEGAMLLKKMNERAHEHLCYLLIDQGSFGTASKSNSNSLAIIYLILAK